MKTNKLLSIILIIISILLILIPTSQAALQSNGGTEKKDKLNNLIVNIRKMEGIGGTLGLTETINSDLTSSSGSNNLDIHMEKNTEYGAMAILSASSYGNPNIIADGETTTGNKTGVIMKINQELVAAVQYNTLVDNCRNANAIYRNTYEEYDYRIAKYVKMNGDALTETAGWHGSGVSQFLSGNSGGGWTINAASSVLTRAYSGSIFSYNGKIAQRYTDSDCGYERAYPSRAVVVVGEGV